MLVLFRCNVAHNGSLKWLLRTGNSNFHRHFLFAVIFCFFEGCHVDIILCCGMAWYGCKMRKVCQMTRRRIGASSRDRNTRLRLQPSADTGFDI